MTKMPSQTSPLLATDIARAAGSVHRNASTPQLVQAAIAGGQGRLTAQGAFVVDTGKYTGRSPKDKFIVRDAQTDQLVWWDNAASMSPAAFDLLLADFTEGLKGRDLHAQELYAGAELAHQLNVTVLTPSAWHALFIRNLLIRPARAALENFVPNVTILHDPEFKADPATYIAKLDKAAADAQRKDYPMDTCAVAGSELGSMGEPVEMVVAGRLIRLCCGGCKPKIEADPAKYVMMVDKAWQAEGKFMPKAKEGEHAGDHGDHNHGG